MRCILQLGSSLSIYGCRKYQNSAHGDANMGLDAERGTYVAPSLGDTSESSNLYKNLDAREERDARETAGAWGYIFQIIFQVEFYFCYQFHEFSICLIPLFFSGYCLYVFFSFLYSNNLKKTFLEPVKLKCQASLYGSVSMCSCIITSESLISFNPPLFSPMYRCVLVLWRSLTAYFGSFFIHF